MPRSRTRAQQRRGRSAGALLCAGLSLAAALALVAPLVHAHLDASDATRGLCGEHHAEGTPSPIGDACSLCVAGAHAAALREPRTPRLATPVAPPSRARAEPEVALGVARSRPGTPRAPPVSA